MKSYQLTPLLLISFKLAHCAAPSSSTCDSGLSLSTGKDPEAGARTGSKYLQTSRRVRVSVASTSEALPQLQLAGKDEQRILLFWAVGSTDAVISLVTKNLENARRQLDNLDVYFAHYDSNRSVWEGRAGKDWYSKNVQFFTERPGHKEHMMIEELTSEVFNMKPYKWVWSLDEDVDFSFTDLKTMMSLADQSQSLLVTPAYTAHYVSFLSHMPQKMCEYRYVPIVENAFPLIQPQVIAALSKCDHCLHEHSTWGLNKVWCAWAAKTFGKSRDSACAVLDKTPVKHMNFKTLEGKYDKQNGARSVAWSRQAKLDMKDVRKHHPDEFVSQPVSAADWRCIHSPQSMQSYLTDKAKKANPSRHSLFDDITCYVLNLDSDKKKFQTFQLRLAAYSSLRCQRFSAVDGRSLGAEELSKHGNLSMGEVGYQKSMAALLQRASHDGTKVLLVFDDDAVVAKDFDARLRKALENHQCNSGMHGGDAARGGVLMLGASEYNMNDVQASNSSVPMTWWLKKKMIDDMTVRGCYTRTKGTLGSYGVVYHRKVFDPILSWMQSPVGRTKPFDWFAVPKRSGSNYLSGFSNYVVWPNLVIQDVRHNSSIGVEDSEWVWKGEATWGHRHPILQQDLKLRAARHHWNLFDFPALGMFA
jgi:hypothetical protein